MGFDHRRTVTFRLAQAAHAYRVRAGSRLARIELHTGQESLLTALADNDGQSMSDLAATLGVQPPTVTKMISRMAAAGLVQRVASQTDGRLARVFLTEEGRGRIDEIDRIWTRIEREALAGFDDKDKKKLRKLLRAIERNLTLPLDGLAEPASVEEPDEDPED